MSFTSRSWASLPTPLSQWILDVIQSMGHSQMTPVQTSTIPLFIQNKDVVVEAVTGSGKTLAFVIPVLERLARRKLPYKKNEIAALVVSPTRELATQIHSVFSLFLNSQPDDPPKHPPALLLVSSDQSSPVQDVKRFLDTGADIVIGTPGRVEEFLLGKGANSVSTKELDILILDEADRLLDLGFQTSLSRILTSLPKQRRTGLFSATMTDADAMSELVRVGLRNPARIVVKVQSKKAVSAGGTGLIEERRIPANLKIFYIACEPAEKLVQLSRIVAHETDEHNSARMIIYFATGACVDYFYRILPLFLPPSSHLFSLHGHLQPTARTRTLSAFASSPCTPTSPSILLATDVAARGLDLPDVDAVLQFDPPSDTKAFSHRCGRTARAGRSGRAWVLLVGRETEYVDFLAVRKIPVRPRARFRASSPSVAGEQVEGEDEEELEDVAATATFTSKIRAKLLTDRDLSDRATTAFVSFARAYGAHEAAYIFRPKDLDFVGLARCYGLLRLPRMPELKAVERVGWRDADVDWDTYAYADEAQETKRLAALADKAASKAAQAATTDQQQREKQRRRNKNASMNAAWSQQSSRKDERERRREKRVRKRLWIKAQGQEQAGTKRARGGGGANEGDEEGQGGGGEDVDDDDDNADWEELKREERLAKKARKGQANQAEERELEAFADL